MTKRELINALEATPVSDDTDVILFDWQKNLDSSDDDGSIEGMYADYEIELHNLNPTSEEIEDYRDRMDDENAELKPVITLNFDNYDEMEGQMKQMSER